MKLVITGGAGGIGSRLVKRLLQDQDLTLVLVDDFSGGHEYNLPEKGAFELIRARVENLTLAQTQSVAQADVYIHLAGRSALVNCQLDHSDAYAANFLSTVSVAKLAMDSGAHFIFASTSAVYEGLTSEIFTEDLEVSPKLIYPLSKRLAEQHLESLHHCYNFPSTSLRLFNVFGETQDQVRKTPPLVNYIAKQLVSGDEVNLYAPPRQARDYVYVEDVIDAILLAIKRQASQAEVFNICSAIPLRMSDIVAAVSRGLNVDSLAFKQRNPDEIWDGFPELFEGPYGLERQVVQAEVLKNSVGSFARAKKELGWEPKISVLSAIEAYAASIGV